MDLQGFKTMILTVDPAATHGKPSGAENYTVWQEYGDNSLFADGKRAASAQKVQVDRYTTVEYDPVAQSLTDLFEENDIPYDYIPETWDPEAEQWRHIWTCEVI